MAKGTYVVREDSDAPSSKDTSFKSCLCVLLIFIAICLIILLAGIKWAKNPSKEEVKGGEAEFLGSKGNITKTPELPPITNTTTHPRTVTTVVRSTLIPEITSTKEPTPISNTTLPNETIGESNSNKSEIQKSTESSTFNTTESTENKAQSYDDLGNDIDKNETQKSTESSTSNTTESTRENKLQSYDDLGNDIDKNETQKSTESSTSNTTESTRENKLQSYDDLGNDIDKNETQKSTESFTSNTTESTGRNKLQSYDDLGNAIDVSTEMTRESTENATEPFTAAIDHMKPSTTGSKTDKETTKSDTNEEPPTDVTETNVTRVILTQNTNQKFAMEPISPLTTLLNAATESSSATTERQLVIYDDQKPVKQSKIDDDDILNTTTAVHIQTSGKNKVTDKIPHWSETTPASEKFDSKSISITPTIQTSTIVNTTPSTSAITASTTVALLPTRTTTTSATESILISIITPAKRWSTTSTTSLPNITPQIITVDRTTSSPQNAFSYTTTETITTSNSNENKIQQSTQSSTSTATDKNNKTFKGLENNDRMTTETSTANTEKATNPFTVAVDYRKTSTTVFNINPTNQVSSTTKIVPDYKMLAVGEVTIDDSSEDYSTDETETNMTPLILTQNMIRKSPIEPIVSSTTLLNPVTESTTSSTTTKKKMKIYGQNPGDEAEHDDDNFITTTAKNIQTTKKNKITDKVASWLEKTYTITNSTLLLRKPEPVCLSVGCKSAASRMLSFMDHSVDACNDFYEFACGGMPAASADSDTWKRLSEQLHLINETAPVYLQTFKTFYDSCVSHEYEFNYQERIDGVLKLVKEVGEISNEKQPHSTIDVTDLFAKLILRQSLPFIDVDIDMDNETSIFVLKLTLPRPTSILKESGRWSALTEAQKRCLDELRHELEQLNLDLTKIYESYLTCQKNHTIYLNSIETVVRALGFYSQLNNTFNESQQIQDGRTTSEWDILDHLNTLPSINTIRQTVFNDYTVQTLSDLQSRYPLLEWNTLFSKVTGRMLTNDTPVRIYFSSYFDNIFKKLQDVDNWKLNNALIATYAHNLYENLVIPQATLTRERYCLKLSSKLFPDVSSNIYMKTWPKTEIEESQKFLTEIFARLQQNLTSVLQKEEWLDNASKEQALLKLNKMELIINKQEDSYNNEQNLNRKYSAVTMTTDFLVNAVKMLEMDRKMRNALVGEKYSIDYLWSYFLNAYDSVPTSLYSKGLIMAPLGMIKQPVKGLPGYITMARIGLSLAREIGRHFDPVGIQNGMTLSPESQSSYKAIMENESLSNVTRFVGHQRATFVVDPKLSVNERIADNTGFRLISDTFHSFREQALLPWVSATFSIEQIFHITVAQEYCQKTDMPEFMQQLFESEILPASLRVENIVTNSKQFSKVFDCRLGSPMNNNPSKIQFPHLLEQDEDKQKRVEL